MALDTAPFDAVMRHLEQELIGIRTGRANPGLVENVTVTAYGSPMPLVQLASITTPDPRTIVVQPWDKNVLKDIERGLQQTDLGLTPMNDGTVIRLSIPALTEERRKEYLKLLNTKLEQARVSIRKIREDLLRTMRDAKQEGTLSENDLFSRQKELQKIIDDYGEKIETHGTKKEQEILTV